MSDPFDQMDALERLYHQKFRLFCIVASRYLPPGIQHVASARDAVNSAYRIAAERIKQGKVRAQDERTMASFFWAVLHRRANKYRRQGVGISAAETNVEDISLLGMFSMAGLESLNDDIKRRIDLLPEPQRTAVWMKYLGFTLEEVGEELNVKTHVARDLAASGDRVVHLSYGLCPGCLEPIDLGSPGARRCRLDSDSGKPLWTAKENEEAIRIRRETESGGEERT